MEIGLMVEGQNGLTWERWRHILALAERLKFPSLFRSDHYFIGPQQDSLEAYLSFVMAASWRWTDPERDRAESGEHVPLPTGRVSRVLSLDLPRHLLDGWNSAGADRHSHEFGNARP